MLPGGSHACPPPIPVAPVPLRSSDRGQAIAGPAYSKPPTRTFRPYREATLSNPAPMTAAAERAGLGPPVVSTFVRDRVSWRGWLSVVTGRGGPPRKWFGLYDGGLVRYIDGRSRARAWTWSDLDSVSINGRTDWVKGKPRRVHRLQARAGGRVFASESRADRFRKFAVRVGVAFSDHRAQRETSIITGGGTVQYGPYTVGPRGITANGEHLPWSSVGEIYLRSGTVAVYRRGDDRRPWSEENWWDEVDVMTFMSVVAQFGEDRT